MPQIILIVDLPDRLSNFNPDNVAALVRQGTGFRCTGQWADQRSEGAELITVERRRQVDEEGYTAAHDAVHNRCEMLHAAQSYLELGEFLAFTGRDDAERFYLGRPPRADVWPWSLEYWKPDYSSPIRNLVKAGALIAAEIDRLVAAT